MSPEKVCAFVPDLMDRSRIRAARADVVFTEDPGACTDAAVVVVDLQRRASVVASVRAAAPFAYIVGFLPHVEHRRDPATGPEGVDTVLPRSRFFRDVRAAIAPPTTGT